MVNWPKQRAWGWYATLIRTPWFCVKVLRFKPNGALSMQRHGHRTEIWFIPFPIGRGLVKCNAEKEHFNKIHYFRSKLLGVWIIRKNYWHQFIAYGKPVYAIELQYGRKITEEDIERK